MDITKQDLLKYGLYQPTISNNETQLESKDCQDILLALLNHLPSDETVNIFIPEENHLADGIFDDRLYKVLSSKNVKLNFVFGGFTKYKLTEKYDFPEHNLFLHLWPTAGIFDSFNSIIKIYPPSKLKFQEVNDFEYLFISLSNKAKTHRCYLLDSLIRDDLLQHGVYTWSNTYANNDYVWRFTDPIKLKNKLNDRFIPTFSTNYEIMPDEYFKAFIHLVSEGMSDGDFITEKTTIPLVHKKPFIVQTTKGFHKILSKKLKFELYDEIFDYEFDQVDDWCKRTDLIIKNLKRLKKENLKNLYQKLLPKLEYNQNRIFEIINKNILVPQIVLDSKTMLDRYPYLTTEI